MTPTPEIIALVDRTPDLDEFGKVHGTPWPENIEIYDALLAKGADAIRQVTGMLKAVDDGTDYKARYVLHGLAVYSGRPDKGREGSLLRETLGAELTEAYPASVKGYLLRQLQWCGDTSGAEVIGAFLLDDENAEYAAQALEAIGGEACRAQIRAALPEAKEKENLLLTLIQGLGVFQDLPSAAAVRPYLDHASETVRLTAAWALAQMGDAEATGGLLALVDAGKGWARTQVADACWTLADKLRVAGKNDLSEKIRQHLERASESAASPHQRLADPALAGS